MARAWSDERRLELWFEVELALVAEREAQGAVPSGATTRLRAAARPDAARMAAIEAECGHDVIAFLRMWAEAGGADARHVHAGMTSADLTDTALALQLLEAGALLTGSLRRLRRAAWDLAQAHRRTVMAGRTHGMHAEPITFGLKCLTWSEELGRGLARLEAALRGCAVGKLSGAVGTLAHLEPATEVAVLARLGLAPEPVASQVVCRDRHAALLAAVAVLGGTMERIAVEVRHLQRSEVREAGEPFGARQQGSSAMPHKRNPVRCERVSGLARLLRGHALAALEDQALWHERDISHSSVERVILPDAFLVADFMADELAAVLGGLRVDPAAMRRNLDAGGGLVHSQRVLLALSAAGMAREEAYRLVQGHALAALEGGPPFREALAADARVGGTLGEEGLAACFELEAHLRGVDALFARAEAPEA
jgi:adenylosuccinate lyase